MTNMEFLDEPAAVTSATDGQGQIMPQSLTWRKRTYSIISVGRQWEQTGNRHILIEASDGTRFEVMFDRTTLSWRVLKVWWGLLIA